MKKFIAALVLGLTINNVSANVVKVCAKQAEEVCKELTDREDFIKCYNNVRDICMDDIYGGYKLNLHSCEEYCGTLPETTMRQLCLQTCGNNHL